MYLLYLIFASVYNFCIRTLLRFDVSRFDKNLIAIFGIISTKLKEKCLLKVCFTIYICYETSQKGLIQLDAST